MHGTDEQVYTIFRTQDLKLIKSLTHSRLILNSGMWIVDDLTIAHSDLHLPERGGTVGWLLELKVLCLVYISELQV